MNKKKNILTIFITICFVINSTALFASRIVDEVENPSDELDPPPSPIDDFIIPMIISAIIYVIFKFYRQYLVEKSNSIIN